MSRKSEYWATLKMNQHHFSRKQMARWFIKETFFFRGTSPSSIPDYHLRSMLHRQHDDFRRSWQSQLTILAPSWANCQWFNHARNNTGKRESAHFAKREKIIFSKPATWSSRCTPWKATLQSTSTAENWWYPSAIVLDIIIKKWMKRMWINKLNILPVLF